jgi:hypothetical protein
MEDRVTSDHPGVSKVRNISRYIKVFSESKKTMCCFHVDNL